MIGHHCSISAFWKLAGPFGVCRARGGDEVGHRGACAAIGNELNFLFVQI
jgi:hypothetical protein